MKVLFFGLEYQNYTRAIISEIECAGAEVTFVDLQPRSVPYKILRTLVPGIFSGVIDKQLVQAIEDSKATAFDTVIFLQAHQMPVEILRTLRLAQKQAKFILYNWDAVSTHNYLPQAAFFDKVFTFDPIDANEHGFHYLPLFCQRDMQSLNRDESLPCHVYTVGNIVNPLRYDAIKAFEAYCDKNGIGFEAFMKISPVIYFKFLLKGRIPRGVTFRSIDPIAFRDLVERSTATFDFANHQLQSGHTMRTFENLCAGKKIITNNQQILNESFFSEDRVFVYEEFNYEGVQSFLARPVMDPKATFDEYHIQTFVRKLIGAEMD